MGLLEVTNGDGQKEEPACQPALMLSLSIFHFFLGILHRGGTGKGGRQRKGSLGFGGWSLGLAWFSSQTLKCSAKLASTVFASHHHHRLHHHLSRPFWPAPPSPVASFPFASLPPPTPAIAIRKSICTQVGQSFTLSVKNKNTASLVSWGQSREMTTFGANKCGLHHFNIQVTSPSIYKSQQQMA